MGQQNSEATLHDRQSDEPAGEGKAASPIFVLPEWLKPAQPADPADSSLGQFNLFRDIIAPLIERTDSAERQKGAVETERDHFRQHYAQAEAAFTVEHEARVAAETNAAMERRRAETVIQRAEQAERERQHLVLAIKDFERRLSHAEAARDMAETARQRAESEAARMRAVELAHRSRGLFARLSGALRGE